MTVCIAAIYGKNKGVVAVSDKMFTTAPGIPTVHEVNENNKITKLSKSAIIMMAGDVTNATAIIAELKASVTAKNTLQEIADKAGELYRIQVATALDLQVFSRWGLTRNEFIEKQQSLDKDLIAKLNQVVFEANLGVELIVAGVDSTGPSLFVINNPGNVSNLNATGVALVGSGSKHAHLSIVDSQFNKGDTCGEVLFESFKAKKRAEYDPNVGKYTSVCVINSSVKEFTDEEVKSVYDIYEQAETGTQKLVNNVTMKLGEMFDGDL